MTRDLRTEVRNLQRRGARRRSSDAILEGVRLAEEALSADVAIRGVLMSPVLARSERGAGLRESVRRRELRTLEVDDRELQALADTDTPQGVIMIVSLPPWQLADIAVGERRPVVILDGVRDPGNVGTIIRTAHALGASGTVLISGAVRANHPKLLRAAMGAAFRHPVVGVNLDSVRDWVRASNVLLWGADAAGLPLRDAPRGAAMGIVIGGEAGGLTPEVRSMVDSAVRIAMVRGAESLNAAVAAGIFIHEVTRGD